MSRLAGVMYICEVCGREHFCQIVEHCGAGTMDYLLIYNGGGKHYMIEKPPVGWTPEMCPDCDRRIKNAIKEEKEKILNSTKTTMGDWNEECNVDFNSISELNFRTLNALKREGLNTIGDLRRRYTWKDILRIRNVGEKSACALAAILQARYQIDITDKSTTPSQILMIDEYVDKLKEEEKDE